MNKFGLGIWLLFFLTSLGVVGWNLTTSFPIDTNILALFPKDDTNTKINWLQKAKSKFDQNAADKIIVVLTHPDENVVFNAAGNLKAKMSEQVLLDDIVSFNPETEINENFPDLIHPYRAGLLSDYDRQLLRDGETEIITKQAIVQILSPFGLSNANDLKTDPFRLLSRYLTDKLRPANSFSFKNGLLHRQEQDTHYVLLTWKLNGSAYSNKTQQVIIPFVETSINQLHTEFEELKTYKTGAVFYAGYAMEKAQNEAALIGTISVIAIIIMMLVVFKHIQPIYLALLSIIVGIVSGFAVTILVFDKIYIFTIVFGAAITGIAVDYAMHYCCTRFSNKIGPDRINLVRRGLFLGAVSSIIGFSILLWPPFPGLQQIGLFSAVGLLMACLTVIFVFPYLDNTKTLKFPIWLRSITKAINYFWYMRTLKTGRLALYVMTFAFVMWGALTFQVNDNLRELEDVSEALKQEEMVIRNLDGLELDTQFFVVVGNTVEDVLQKEEKLRGLLNDLIQMDVLTSYQMLSDILPSIKRQKENRILVRDQLLENELGNIQAVLGYSGKIDYNIDNETYLTIDQLPAIGIENFNLPVDQGVAHLVRLQNLSNLSAMSHIASKINGVSFIDPSAEISNVLSKYRIQVVYLIIFATLFVYVFLSFIYNYKVAFFTLLPSVLAVFLTPLLLSVIGEIFTFFNAMALILVFALGVDYAIFCAETDEQHYLESLAANWLSALSSVFAFGLLALSQQYAVHAFGITILVGVSLAFFMSPLARKKRDAKHG
ncbi:MMPL family transporter [Curvivirga sp.]|uniref:MMPL family transporter n=1 Tax=Curvivirga sp. TaxID=2856848 RepID=UPI003B59E652